MTKANLFPYRHYDAPPSHHTWNEINPILPKTQIEVLGPPPTPGTPDVLAELALEAGCQSFSWLKAKKDKDKIFFQNACMTIRQDGAYIEAGENDNVIEKKPVRCQQPLEYRWRKAEWMDYEPASPLCR
ncbi:MAG: hypothetical protein DM484_00755 [Candidatus Methylumidiphilus alinenensis]|uniref:Uncharacterized protein n=1 Tax=Candidatus Methylumidiphilus alinenensis TaxID=2202197 RepID=A0A2W4RWM1_9GAMM|nr:MAG: hypothetical protein DM484_00755 [Candidatus Methylumidiphilus alinenensis]